MNAAATAGVTVVVKRGSTQIIIRNVPHTKRASLSKTYKFEPDNVHIHDSTDQMTSFKATCAHQQCLQLQHEQFDSYSTWYLT